MHAYIYIYIYIRDLETALSIKYSRLFNYLFYDYISLYEYL